MTLTYPQATDEIKSFFWSDWNSVKTSSIVGYVPKVFWQGITEPDPPDSDAFWARFSIQTVFEEQSGLSGGDLSRRYTTSGLIFIQIFCPKSESRGFEFGQQLASVGRASFRGRSTPGGVWFRNVRINELNPEQLCYRFNVVSEFEFDEYANIGS